MRTTNQETVFFLQGRRDSNKFRMYTPGLIPVRVLDYRTELGRRTVGERSDDELLRGVVHLTGVSPRLERHHRGLK